MYIYDLRNAYGHPGFILTLPDFNKFRRPFWMISPGQQKLYKIIARWTEQGTLYLSSQQCAYLWLSK